MDNKKIDYQQIGFLDGEHPENNIIYFLHKHAQFTPQKIAIKWADQKQVKAWDGSSRLHHQSINYRDFVSLISRLAAGFKNLGIDKGDRVIIFIPMSLNLYLAMFAVQRIGAIAVFLDSWARKDHLGLCAKTAKPKAMISFEQAFGVCQGVEELNQIQH